MPEAPSGRYGLVYILLMAALPLHLTPGFGIATCLIVSAALAWLYRLRARETGQIKAAVTAMVLWVVFACALSLAINGRSAGFLPIQAARVLAIIAIPALGLSWLFSLALWRGWYVR